MSSLDRYADDFERLRALAPAQRAAALDALPLATHERERLARLLAADVDASDPLARALGDGAARLFDARSERLGAYRLLRELGAGGMGTVFLAERVDGGFAQAVAVKLLRGFPTADGLRRLRQERQILAGLDHPHIARLIDGGETAEGQPWLALEYVDGLPLLDHAALHAPRLVERLALFDAMLDAVGHAHRRLVVHRDLKPANVLVNTAGEVKLLDFGIARLIDLEEADGRPSTRVFSPGYASPEQRAGAPITTATDIYSLGVLLHELASARRLDGAPAHAGLCGLPVDRDFAAIVACATADDPARRYASADAFRDDLVRYRDGRPVLAARGSAAYHVRKFVVRHRIAAVAAIAAAAGIAFFIGRLDLARERALAAEAVAQTARAASERDAASARAALDFLTAAFRAAAPETALRRDVSVRSLLDAARASLATSNLDAPATQTMQRLLARLYAELGERAAAVGLLRAGLSGVIAGDRGEALRLAADYDLLSGQLSSADDGADSTAAANAADALRARWAPDDAIERIRTLISLATARDRAGDGTRTVALLREADALARDHPVTPDLAARIAIPFAGALAGSDCNEAETVAAGALRRVDAELPRESPQRRQLLAARANVLQTCGRWAEAEPLLREAIALQTDVVGPGGGDMIRLTTQLSQLLAQLGRLPEAAALLTDGSAAIEASGLDDVEAATLLGNRADLLDAAGDYASSLAASREAAALLDRSGVGADHLLRRQLRRNQARTFALAGDYARAVAELTDLRERAARVDGAESVEYASVIWQLAAAARVAEDAESGMPLLEEAVGLWRKIAPAGHPIFAYAERCRAAFAMIRRDYARADAAFAQALPQLEALNVPPSDLATARSERADLWRRQGRVADARAMLAQALPVLRESYLPTQRSRAGAERTAAQLGMR